MGPKKVKLTKEQKKELKEQKKIEKKLAAEEKIKQIKRDHLLREIKYTDLNKKKLEKSWKETLRAIKIQEIKIQFKQAVKHVEKVIDIKDFIITLLIREMNDAEEQYMYNFCEHVKAIETYISIYHDRMNTLKKDFFKKMIDIVKESQEEKENMLKRFHVLPLKLLSASDKHEENANYISTVERSEIFGRIYAYAKKLKDDIYEQMRQLNEQFNDNITVYFRKLCENGTRTDLILKDYCKIQEHTSLLETTNHDATVNISKLIDYNDYLKNAETSSIKYNTKVIEELLKEKQYILESFISMRNRLRCDTATDNSQILFLTTQSNNTIKILETKRNFGKKILSSMSICRKYETLKEKVLPYPDMGITPEESPKKETKYKRIVKFSDLEDLNNFWQKCGQADALRHILCEERAHLREENKYLRSCIERYCTEKNFTCCSIKPKLNPPCIVQSLSASKQL